MRLRFYRAAVAAGAALVGVLNIPHALWGQTAATWLTATSGSWTDPTRWSTNPAYPNNGQPSPGDTYRAEIGAMGNNYTITLDRSIALDSLSITWPGATLSQTSGATLTVANETRIDGYYQLRGYFFGGPMLVNGQMDCIWGTIGGGGTTTVAAGGILNFGDGTTNTHYSLDNRTIVNYGLLTVHSGSLSLNTGTPNSGTLINMPGGLIDLDRTFAAAPIAVSEPETSALVNYGRIRVGSIGTGSSPGLGAMQVNGGTIDVRKYLYLGTLTHNNGSVLTGPGTIVLGGGQVLTSGTTTWAGGNMTMSGYGISGAGHLDVGGTLNWSGSGSIGGSGEMQILPGATLNLKKSLGVARRLDNWGVINIPSSARLGISSGIAFTNRESGVINLVPPTWPTDWSSFGAAFTNLGTVTYSLSGGTASFAGTDGPTTVNAGTVVVNNGILYYTKGTHLAGSTLAGNGFIDLGGGYSGGNHTVIGRTTLAAANMSLNSGSISGTGELVISGTLNWGGGTISTPISVAHGGVLNLGIGTSSSGSHVVEGLISNRGVINVNAGSLEFRGYYGSLDNQAGGVFNLSSAVSLPLWATPKLTNSGTMNLSLGTASFQTGTLIDSNGGVIAVHTGSFICGRAGGFTHYNGATYSGAGYIEFASPGYPHELLGTTTLGGSHMVARTTFAGPGALNVTGNLAWQGSIEAAGGATVASGATVTLSGGSAKGCTVNNYGLVDYVSNRFGLNAATFDNRAGGVLNLISSDNFQNGTGTNHLSNEGTINVAETGASISVPFVNVGTVNIGGAPLRLNVPTESGGVFNGPVDNSSALTLAHYASAGAIDGTGTVQVAAIADVTAGRIRQGSLSLLSASRMRLRPNGTESAVSRVASLSLGSSSVLDLSDNDLVIDYLPGSSPISSIQSHLRWGSLTTSLASAGHRLGYAEASALGISLFSGQAVDATSLCIKYTFAGDANLDGVVDVIDLGNLVTAWQSTGTWIDGDFSYDGTIDVIDLGMLAGNWQAGMPAGPCAGRTTLPEALASFGLPDVRVPEPAWPALMALTLLHALCRLRHRPGLDHPAGVAGGDDVGGDV